jgi:hypothetical protein
MALDKLKYTYQDPARVSELNVDDILNVTNTINTTTVNSKAEVISPTTSNVGLTLKGASFPNYDLVQIQDSTSTLRGGINSAGNLYLGSNTTYGAGAYSLTIASGIATSATTANFVVNSTVQPLSLGQQVQISSSTPSYFNGNWTVTAVSLAGNSTWSFSINGSGFTPGGVNLGTGLIRPSAQMSILPSNGQTTPLIIQQHPNSQQNLTEWQNPTGNAFAYINGAGTFVTSGNINASNITLNAGTAIQLNGNIGTTGADTSYINMRNISNNTFGTGSIYIFGGNTAMHGLVIRAGGNITGTISTATANGTNIVYTSASGYVFGPKYVSVGQTITVTGIVSTGNPSGTAGSGFNVTNATVTAATSTNITVTVALTDTYTSGGSFTTTNNGLTGDLLQFQNSAGGVIAKIAYGGGATFTGNTLLSGGLSVQGNYGGTNTVLIANNQDIVGLTIKANNVQSNSLLELRDSNNNLVTYFGPAGQIVSNQTIGSAGYMYSVQPASFGSNGLNNTYQVQVINGTAARIAFMIKAAASQTGNLTEWQDSNSNVIALVNSSAEFRGTGLVNLSSYQNSRFLPQDAGALINTNIVGNVGLRVQNTNVSATADLQQWQNSSGTVLSKIDISGNFSKGDGDQLVLANQIF